MPQLTYAESLTYWLGSQSPTMYTILLSKDSIKVMPTNEDRDISSHYSVYSKSIKKEQIKNVLLAYTHLKWDVSEVYGLI